MLRKEGMKMVLINRITIVFILVFFLGVFVFSQDKQVNDDKDKKLREEILIVYQTKGEQGLRDFVKTKKDEITNKFIVDLAKSGSKEGNEKRLKISLCLAKENKNENILANIHSLLGEYYLVTAHYEIAITHFDKSLTLYLKLKDVVGQGVVYLNKGEIYFYKGDYLNAENMYEKASSLFKKVEVPLYQADIYAKKGDIYLYTGEITRAMEMYEKALSFFEKADFQKGQGDIYRRMGYLLTGNSSSALDMYDKALTFYENVKDYLGQGNVYQGKGDIFLHSGEYFKALEMYKKAIPYFEKMGDLLGKANIYFRQGQIYFNEGDNTRALDMYDKALSLYEKINAPLGQGNIYMFKGSIYLYTGNKLKAFEMYNKAMAFYVKLGNILGQANVFGDMGDLYFLTGNNERALEMYNKAMPFHEKARNILGQGNLYLRKGNIYSETGDNSKAFEMYNKAMILYEKAGNPIGQGSFYINKGHIYLEIGDTSRAFELYEKALSFFKKLGHPIGQGTSYMKMGDIYFRNGDNTSALAMHDKALFFFDKVEAIELQSIAMHAKSKVFINQGKNKKALALIEKAISKLDKIRTQTAFSEMKKTFMETVYEKYEETVLFMLENNYLNKGFKYAESMKARVFLDRMGEGLVPLEKGLKPELKEKRDKLVAKLSNISKKMQETGGNEETKLAELKEKYKKAQDEFEELLIKIRIDNPFYASVRYPVPISVQSLQNEVLKKGEILVRYFITPDKTYVFLVSKKRFKVVPLEVKAEKIKSYVNRWLIAVNENSTGDMERCGKLLYRELFKPIEAKLKGDRDIIIIPDSHLEKIPFEAFIMGEAKSGRHIFLLEKYRIKYIQSASLLSLLRKHYQRGRETKNFIGFGDPVYDYKNFKQGQPEQGSMKTFATESTEVTESTFSHEDTRSDTKEKRVSSVSSVSSVAIEDEIKEIFRSRYARVGGLMNRLQGSGEEIRTIARLFENKSHKSLIYLREQATEDNAKAANLKEFDYIHFACHGILEDEFQCLALSQLPEAQSSEDGYFTLNEIMNCDYNAKLVVLSGCRTGSGKMERAEGVTGLTRAVMYAGTPAVVSSLWRVDDQATKKLMVTFYRNMLEKNLDKTEALRQAKLELLKNPKYYSPLFWSAFVMYGE